jgi:hypothetical protein
MIDDLQPLRAARASKLRRLGVFGLLLVFVVLAMLTPGLARSAEPESGWTDEARAELYVLCRQRIDDHRFCSCAVDALAALSRAPGQTTESEARAAMDACPAPRAPRAPDLKI